jgi:1-acyl-sn-glycerol-3-phosphate acyltransferase
VRDLTYPPIIVLAKLGFRALGFRFQMSGTEHVPRSGGAVLALNHISYLDFVLGGYAAQPSKRLVRFMSKRELFDHRWTSALMRSLHHISVDRAEGVASYDEGVRYLRMGEVVGIFPEATISRSFELKELKTGAARMAAAAGVPLVPAVLWGTQRIKTKDHPQDFSRGKTIAISVGTPREKSCGCDLVLIRWVPQRTAGTRGTPASAAIRVAPVLNSLSSKLREMVASGKIPTTSPRRR